MSQTGRIYLCARCRRQVVVCQRCDRGQIYCTADCSVPARCEAQRAASQRYQSSPQGRFAHAERSRRYRTRLRDRQCNVTHQGSAVALAGDLLRINTAVTVIDPISATGSLVIESVELIGADAVAESPAASSLCQHCGAPCPGGVRLGFIRHRRRPLNHALVDSLIRRALLPTCNDHWP